jgi:hypothetical protein
VDFGRTRTSRGPEWRGIALPLPHLAERVALVLGPFGAGLTVYLLASGEDTLTVEPALLAFLLLLFGAWLRLRHRADVTAWHEMLATPIGRTRVDRERSDITPARKIRTRADTSPKRQRVCPGIHSLALRARM